MNVAANLASMAMEEIVSVRYLIETIIWSANPGYYVRLPLLQAQTNARPEQISESVDVSMASISTLRLGHVKA